MEIHESSPRLPRFVRQRTGKPPLVLQPRDADIVRCVAQHRFIASEDLRLLVDGSGQGILRRLQRLFQHGYLDRPRIQRVRGNETMVYALGQKGAELLADEVGKGISTDWSEKNRQVQLRYLEHGLMISRFQVAVRHAAECHGRVAIESWLPDGAIAAAVRVERENRVERIPVRPDAFCIVRVTGGVGGRIHCCLEADRSTMTVARFVAKLRGYFAYWRSGEAQKQLGMRNFLVLTVTRSAERAEHLVEACRAVSDRGLRMFLFVNEQKYTPAATRTILDAIWTTPADSIRHSLLE